MSNVTPLGVDPLVFDLVGRAAELSTAADVLRLVRNGSRAVLVVSGEPGVGKSTLLEQIRILSTDITVLRATGLESEMNLPHAGLIAVLGPLLGRFHELSEASVDVLNCAFGRGSREPPEPFAIAAAALELLAVAASRTPVLVILDDAHWIDTQSVSAILFALRRLSTDRVGGLIGVRTGHPLLGTMSDLPHMTLAGLSMPDSVVLVNRVDSSIPAAVAEQIALRTGGIPLALMESTLSLTIGQRHGTEALPTELFVGAGIRRRYEESMALLTDGARTALAVAACDSIGELRPVRIACRQIGLPEGALQNAAASGFIRIGETSIEFRHPLIRAVAREMMSTEATRSIHASLAAALNEPEDVGRRAWHLAVAETEPTAEIADALSAAATEAESRGDLAMATRLFRRASELAVGDAERSLLLLRAGTASAHGGFADGPHLLRAARNVASTGDVRDHADLLLARHAAWVGDTEVLTQVIDGALAAASPAVSAALHAIGAQTATMELQPEEANRHTTALANLLPSLTSAESFHPTLAISAAHLMFVSELPAMSPPYERYFEQHDFDLAGPLAFTLLARGNVVWANRIISNALQQARRLSVLPSICWLRVTEGFLNIAWNRPLVARAAASDALDLAELIHSQLTIGACHAVLSLVAADLGDETTCRHHVHETLEASARVNGRLVEALARLAEARLEARLGREDIAIALFSEMLTDAKGRQLRSSTHLPVLREIIPLLVRAGELKVAAERLRDLEADATGLDLPEELTHLERCRALVDGRSRDPRALGVTVRPDHRDQRTRSSSLESLTPQEWQVADLAATGISTRDIARTLFVSPKTVEAHLTRIYRKMQVRGRAQLGHRFRSEGLRGSITQM